jgi:hypothetical protein
MLFELLFELHRWAMDAVAAAPGQAEACPDWPTGLAQLSHSSHLPRQRADLVGSDRGFRHGATALA